MTTTPTTATFGDVTVTLDDGHVAEVELHRPPANYFDTGLLVGVVDAVAWAEAAGGRAVVLCAEGKHFCAGLDFGAAGKPEAGALSALYGTAQRLIDGPLPLVAAVQGSAIGGGLGLALAADFRVAAPSSRFSANFARLGFHQGFGISITLPAVVGRQRALELLATGRRIDGAEALAIGLVDQLDDDPRSRGPPPGRRDRRICPTGRTVHPGHTAGRCGRPVRHHGRTRAERTAPPDGDSRFPGRHCCIDGPPFAGVPR